jgi:hypothetical protein
LEQSKSHRTDETIMTTELNNHKDLLGRTVAEGDAVAFTHQNSLYVGKVIKITPKQVRVVDLLSKYRSEYGYLKYTKQCVLIGGPDLTLHLLKNM